MKHTQLRALRTGRQARSPSTHSIDAERVSPASGSATPRLSRDGLNLRGVTYNRADRAMYYRTVIGMTMWM